MKPAVCRICGKAEWRHICAGASNAASNKESHASNREATGGVTSMVQVAWTGHEADQLSEDTGRIAKQHSSDIGEIDSRAQKTKQRWSRKSYNAYQRTLMQLRRALVSGRACNWPRRGDGNQA